MYRDQLVKAAMTRMSPKPKTLPKGTGAGWRRQRGIGLPAAIFVITVMTAIVVGINMLVSQNTASFAEDIRLTRAFYAAESGAGFGVRALFPADKYADQELGSCAAQTVYTFDVPGLAGCEAEVSCELDTQVDGVDYHLITSRGICGETTRTVQVTTRFLAAPD